MRWTSACTLDRVKTVRGLSWTSFSRSFCRDLAVTFEVDLVDDRIFDHVDGELRAVELDLHVGEQAGLIQRLERDVGGLLVVDVALAQRDVGDDGRRLDALRAVDDDVLDGARLGNRRGGGGRRCRGGLAGLAGAAERPASASIRTNAGAARANRANRVMWLIQSSLVLVMWLDCPVPAARRGFRKDSGERGHSRSPGGKSPAPPPARA